MFSDPECRLCGTPLEEFVDFGMQPMANAFLKPEDFDREFLFRLAVGICEGCMMVQLIDEVPNDRMFHKAYPYRTSGSSVMVGHFERTAREFLDSTLRGRDSFIVEVGSNDGSMLNVIRQAGVRHLGIEPCGDLADYSADRGIEVVCTYFDEAAAQKVADTHGQADIIFSANTISHISYLDSVFRGADALLKPDGVFVFEDPYFADILQKISFDQIYDEHVYFFTAHSIQATAARFGFELVDVAWLPVHGGEVRYTVARAGARTPAPSVGRMLAEERAARLHEPGTLKQFAINAARQRDELRDVLSLLARRGQRVAGYGATAKSATLLNYAGIGPSLISYTCDNTEAKQGRFMPGSHIPVFSPEAFHSDYPDYAVLFAWNHAEEIMAKEQAFRDAGGKWIVYVPDVRII